MKGAKYYVMLHALGCGCFLLRGIGSKLEGVSNVVNLCNQWHPACLWEALWWSRAIGDILQLLASKYGWRICWHVACWCCHFQWRHEILQASLWQWSGDFKTTQVDCQFPSKDSFLFFIRGGRKEGVKDCIPELLQESVAYARQEIGNWQQSTVKIKMQL